MRIQTILFATILTMITQISKAQRCEGPLTVTMIGASSSLPISIEEETIGVYCTESAEGTVNLKVYGGTPEYSYDWAHNDINKNVLTDLPVGSYHVTVSDANGCTDERTITIVNVDPLTDSLDLVSHDACGACYLHDGTQSFFYFEDEYIGALIDIKTEKDLGNSLVCAEIVEETPYCQGDASLKRSWCFKTDSIENANVRLFFSEEEIDYLAKEVGYPNGIQLINSGLCYLKIFDFEENDCEKYTPVHLYQNEFTTTMFDEDNRVWSIEIMGVDDSCVKFMSLGSTLPITLLDFDGITMGDRNRLYWATANEVNNEGFVIEKSKNGLQFDSIGYVLSLNQEASDYTFDDMVPWTGNNFYRLKQIDQDGSFTNSHIIRLMRKADFDFSILENPFQEDLRLVVESQTELEGAVAVFAMDGRLIFNQEYEIGEGRTPITISLEDIIPGNYLIRFHNKTRNEFLTKRSVKI